jgi:hypothetical protein
MSQNLMRVARTTAQTVTLTSGEYLHIYLNCRFIPAHIVQRWKWRLFPLRKCPIILCHFSPYSRIGYHLCTFQYFNLISLLGQRVVTVNTASLRPPPGGGKPGALTLPTTIKALQVSFFHFSIKSELQKKCLFYLALFFN